MYLRLLITEERIDDDFVESVIDIGLSGAALDHGDPAGTTSSDAQRTSRAGAGESRTWLATYINGARTQNPDAASVYPMTSGTYMSAGRQLGGDDQVGYQAGVGDQGQMGPARDGDDVGAGPVAHGFLPGGGNDLVGGADQRP